MLYKHTQTGWVVLVSLGAMGALIAGLFRSEEELEQGWPIPLALLALIAILFCSLTIEISTDKLCWKFGPGWFRKSVSLQDIAGVEPTRISFWWGWGIHLTPKGWL